jgi:hypothetical protein
LVFFVLGGQCACRALFLFLTQPPIHPTHSNKKHHSLAIGAALFPRIVRMRIIMHGLAVHANVAAGLSSLTWAAGLRPGEAAPRAMDPLRATVGVTAALYIVVGVAIPSTAVFADQRWGRHRFRLRHEVLAGGPAAAAAAAAAARRRCADALLLDAAALAAFTLCLWAFIEEVDAAWPVNA